MSPEKTPYHGVVIIIWTNTDLVFAGLGCPVCHTERTCDARYHAAVIEDTWASSANHGINIINWLLTQGALVAVEPERHQYQGRAEATHRTLEKVDIDGTASGKIRANVTRIKAYDLVFVEQMSYSSEHNVQSGSFLERARDPSGRPSVRLTFGSDTPASAQRLTQL